MLQLLLLAVALCLPLLAAESAAALPPADAQEVPDAEIDDEEVALQANVLLLQTGLQQSRHQRMEAPPPPAHGDPITPGHNPPPPPQCQVKHWQSCATPLPELARSMPGTDLYCYFGFLGQWTAACAVSDMTKNYLHFAYVWNYSYMLPKTGDYWNVSYDGGWYLSNNNHFVYDDFYCHANRWLRGQGLPDKRTNYSAWSAVSEGQCKALMSNNFPASDLSIDDMDRRTGHEFKAIMARIWGRGPAPTTLDMQRHAAVKCALGGAGCDMAFCQNWCLMPGNIIGRNEEECGEYW